MDLSSSIRFRRISACSERMTVSVFDLTPRRLLASSIRIIREYERVVQFRLGRLTGAKGPGIILILPVINRLVKVDLRERYLEVPHQTAITKDNAPVDIDFLIYYKVVDASASIAHPDRA